MVIRGILNVNMTTNKPLRVFYLSSGRLGIHVLDALMHDDRINLVGVGSQPDKPSGRKKIPTPTPVAAFAEEHGLVVDKIVKVNDPAFLQKLRDMNLNVIVVASFGQILKPELLAIPQFGCFNVHASLLPKYRGASPITQAILNGEENAGISFMDMDKGLDTGGVYKQCTVPIAPDDTTDSLENKLGIAAADDIVDVLTMVAAGELTPVPQDHQQSTYAGKIRKTDGAVNWHVPAEQLERKIRAYVPWPTVFMMMPTTKGLKRVQITQAECVQTTEPNLLPGTLLSQSPNGITVACQKGAINITRLVPEGRNDMSVADFLRGTKIPEGAIFNDYPLEVKSS